MHALKVLRFRCGITTSSTMLASPFLCVRVVCGWVDASAFIDRPIDPRSRCLPRLGERRSEQQETMALDSCVEAGGPTSTGSLVSSGPLRCRRSMMAGQVIRARCACASPPFRFFCFRCAARIRSKMVWAGQVPRMAATSAVRSHTTGGRVSHGQTPGSGAAAAAPRLLGRGSTPPTLLRLPKPLVTRLTRHTHDNA